MHMVIRVEQYLLVNLLRVDLCAYQMSESILCAPLQIHFGIGLFLPWVL